MPDGKFPIRSMGHRLIRNEPLNAEDWREIYDFIRFQQQPFLERIVERARRRAADTPNQDDHA